MNFYLNVPKYIGKVCCL